MDADFRIGEFLVSPALNQISRNGTSARIEPKAMRVLVYLAVHPGVISKEQLISAVWPDVFVSEDVLPGCISALRKMLNDDARRPKFIESCNSPRWPHAAFGYRAGGGFACGAPDRGPGLAASSVRLCGGAAVSGNG